LFSVSFACYKRGTGAELFQRMRFSIFTKIILIICLAIILPLIASNYFIITTYQKFIDEYISGIEVEAIRTQFEIFQRNAMIQNFIICFLIFIVVLVVFLIISRILVRPIKKLLEGTQEVIKGNLDAKVSIKTGDELEVLAGSFNQMVKHLKEAFLKAEEEHDRTLGVILNFVDGVLVFDENNYLRIINPKAEKILQVADYKNVVGKNLQDLKKIPSFVSLIELIGEKEIRQISKKEIRLKGEFALDDKASIFEVSTVPLPHGEELFGHLVILYDVSREKFVDKLKSEFISLAAHQLRTPTSVAKWTIDSILKGEAGRATKKQEELLQKAYFNNERMIAIIDDLLNVTRIEEGRFLGKFAKESIEKLIDEVVQKHRETIKEKNIKVETIFPPRLSSEIEIDKESIMLAVDNLIDNAIKYTSRGGEVTIKLSCDKIGLKAQIKDAGIGIPEYQQDRVFSKFFRGDNAVKIGTSGTGLGLFIVKNIIEAHNGKVGFKSEENKGSTFWFTLPVKQQ